MLGSSGLRDSCLIAVYVALVLSRVSAHCALVRHHRENYPSSGQSGISTPTMPVDVHAALLGNPPPIMPFQCYPVNPPLPSSLPPELMRRGLKDLRSYCFEKSQVGHNHTIENSPTLLGTTGNDLCQEMESLHPKSHLWPRGMKRKHSCHLTAPDGPEFTET